MNLFLLHNSGFQNIAGYDLSTNAINNLKKYAKMKGINIHFDVCDLNNKLPENLIEISLIPPSLALIFSSPKCRASQRVVWRVDYRHVYFLRARWNDHTASRRASCRSLPSR